MQLSTLLSISLGLREMVRYIHFFLIEEEKKEGDGGTDSLLFTIATAVVGVFLVGEWPERLSTSVGCYLSIPDHLHFHSLTML